MSNSRTNVDILRELNATMGGTGLTVLDASVAVTQGLTTSGSATVINAGGLRLNNVVVADDQTIDYFKNWTDFSPVLAFGGASVGITYTTQQGRYMRIADAVLFYIRIVLSSKGSSTGAATITGLPFNTAFPVPFIARAGSGFSSLSNSIWATSSGGTISIVEGAATGEAAVADTKFTNTSNFGISGFYQVA